MTFITKKPGDRITLTSEGGRGPQVHVLEEASLDAINTALAANRPLLVRGEPGVGKSQLARAAAKALGRVYISKVVDARTEAQDLLWQFDAVARLAEAQIAGAIQAKDLAQLRADLAVQRFVSPGPLWWAFDWADACKHVRNAEKDCPEQPDDGQPGKGAVLLIDEIDKAETDVPNGLLEALGASQFTPLGRSDSVVATDPKPLVIVTSNEERALPDAFVRRCFVLHLTLPDGEEELIEHLTVRGQAHFESMDEEVRKEAAGQLVADRIDAKEARRRPLPGQAEYLDILRALDGLAKGESKRQLKLLDKISGFALKKHKGAG